MEGIEALLKKRAKDLDRGIRGFGNAASTIYVEPYLQASLIRALSQATTTGQS